ncbi:hydrogenase 4 subunit B [Benzoatithermus flavus]|uniref:Hydrogenase 4 subunit B n=1 Tax=Benzoatithermus flavus TaxID=3108223 RepID=A0ABU8XV21_9PROT
MLIAGAFLPLLGILLALAVLGLVRGDRACGTGLTYGGTLATCSILLLAALVLLLQPSHLPQTLILPLGLPWLGMHFRLDALTAFFLLVVDLGGALACLYALGYAKGEPEPKRVLPFVPAFLLGMNLVLLADDAFTFLLAWEFMSLTSWALVLREHEARATREGAYLYLVMASLGTAALLLCFGLLAGPGGAYDFTSIRRHALGPTAHVLVLVLALLGAGSKAGLVPLHAWLPPAHAAAPSHVSALMSGVMTKVAVYAALRLLFDLAGPPGWWWGAVLMVLGAVSAVLGLLYAVLQNDLKRLLAYSTVENLGIVYIALGFALAFAANGMPTAAALALSAAFLHVLNHTLFKSLLFMGAGAVLHGTGGERDMDRLGGLIHRLPVTSACCLLGAAAISALPPLNGFVSEWLLFQAVLVSPALPEVLRFLAPAVGALMALAAALAAACFVRAYGITFLGRPRSEAAAHAHEIDHKARLAMIAAAALCVLLGVFPGPVIDLLSLVVAELNHDVTLPAQGRQGWLSLVPIEPAHSSYNGLVLLVFVLASAGLAAGFVHRFASRALRRGPAWDCGYPDPDPRTQYSAASFSQPLRRVFGTVVFRASEQVDMPAPGETRPARFTVRWHDLVWERLYMPTASLVGSLADRLNILQYLTVRRYLSMMFAALVTLLIVVAAWR